MSVEAGSDPFTRLAEDVRQGEVPHLRAGHLLPGDVVRIDGLDLTVERVSRRSGRVAIDFAGLGDYFLLRGEDELIETVRLAASAPCSAKRGGLWL
jgi:hypothetical protein